MATDPYSGRTLGYLSSGYSEDRLRQIERRQEERALDLNEHERRLNLRQRELDWMKMNDPYGTVGPQGPMGPQGLSGPPGLSGTVTLVNGTTSTSAWPTCRSCNTPHQGGVSIQDLDCHVTITKDIEADKLVKATHDLVVKHHETKFRRLYHKNRSDHDQP